MNRRFFEEVQSYGQSRSLWYVFIVLSLAIFTPLMYGVYGQLALGIPWGDKPIKDEGLIALFIVLIVIVILVFIALMSVEMQVYVVADGIHYKSYVSKAKWATITRESLATFEIRQKRRTILDAGGRAFYKKYAGKMTCAILRGEGHLELTLTNQSKILLGTQRPDEFARAIRKMLEIDTSYHGG